MYSIVSIRCIVSNRNNVLHCIDLVYYCILMMYCIVLYCCMIS